jgi:hypothetical protein
MNSPNLTVEAMCRILGAKYPLPLTPVAMAQSLRVAFYPAAFVSNKLNDFLAKLRSALINSGVNVISYEDALAEGDNGRIGKGIVLIAPGEGETGNLAIDHVASLSNNTVVGVLDGTLPGAGGSALQKRVNALVSALVWHMAHVLIYVDESTWTTCNMNGAIDTFALEALDDRVLHSLVPKLAAPVIPPQKDDFDVHEDAFDPLDSGYNEHVADLVAGAETWGKTGLLISQTKINELAFRNAKYRRIAAAFLSWRTGMSYGFLSRQLPVVVRPAVALDEAPRLLRILNWQEKDFYEVDGHICVGLRIGIKRFLVRIPKVSVLCTRSGCEKTHLNPATDFLKLSLINGRVIVGAPKDIGGENDSQPSFDTITILAHAVGNAIVGSILETLKPASQFCRTLKLRGLALAHWHGFVRPTELPLGYYQYGETNPPVSCSTPQAAIYALSGKLAALEKSFDEGVDFVSDVHVEPSHGTNITGNSLSALAELALRTAM